MLENILYIFKIDMYVDVKEFYYNEIDENVYEKIKIEFVMDNINILLIFC